MQAPLWSGSPAVGHLKVIDVYGRVKSGVSKAIYVRAENGCEYVAKGPSLSSDNFYVAFNEMVAISLARLLGLPVLDHSTLDMGGQILFGTSRMKRASFFDVVDEELFRKCDNRSRVYDLVVFDSWLCNRDRHPGNLVVRHEVQRQTRTRPASERYLLMLHDHSHCPVDPRLHLNPQKLRGLINASIELEHIGRIPFIRRYIRDRHELRKSIGQVEAIDDDAIRWVIQGIPEEFLPLSERGDIETFLIGRKARLRRLFEDSRSLFDRLESGAL